MVTQYTHSTVRYKTRGIPPHAPGVSIGASSCTCGMLEVPIPIVSASGKMLALASPAARGGVELSQAE